MGDTICYYYCVTVSFVFSHLSCKLAQLTVTPLQLICFFCLYRPPPSKKNRLTESAFFSEFGDFLEHCNLLRVKMLIFGDFNFHFDCPTNFACVMDMLQTLHFFQVVKVPTHCCGHTLDLVVHRKSLSSLLIVSLS